MTEETFMDLDSREKVCSRVMGYTVISGVGCFPMEEAGAYQGGDLGVLQPVPTFAEVADAGPVFAGMVGRGFEVEIQFEQDVNEWEVTFGKKLGTDPTWTAFHPNFATAVAEAALMAIERQHG
jgi:hypothetical protein